MWIERGEVKKGSGVEPSATVLGLGSIQLGKCSNLTSDFSLQKATELAELAPCVTALETWLTTGNWFLEAASGQRVLEFLDGRCLLILRGTTSSKR